jgi:signal transduction histidine kinase
MKRLVSGLLNIARIESGQLKLEKSQFDLVQLILEITEELSPIAEAQGVELLAPSPSLSLTVSADRMGLSQVLANLLSNAIKFSPKGGKVKLNCSKEEGKVKFSVEDQGRGIPAERTQEIFDRFKQSRPEDSKIGTGLGLFITKSIIELHHGSIDVNSGVDKGTTFTVGIPA